MAKEGEIPKGFLTDEDIESSLDHIFRNGSFDPKSVRHSSYQLRLGEVKLSSKALHENQRFEEFQQLKWSEKKENSYVEIAPRQKAQLITKEFFKFPNDMLGFVFSRGLLFSLGLTPETTYVDPGFSKNLYITIINNSGNVIRLNKMMHIGRLFIYKLSKNVTIPYIDGADIGIAQQLRQFPVRKLFNPEDIKKASNKELLDSIQGDCSIADLLTQIIIKQKRMNSQNKIWLVFLSAILGVIIFGSYITLLIGKITLPPWLPEESIKGTIPFVITFCVFIVQSIVKSIAKKLRPRRGN